MHEFEKSQTPMNSAYLSTNSYSTDFTNFSKFKKYANGLKRYKIYFLKKYKNNLTENTKYGNIVL